MLTILCPTDLSEQTSNSLIYANSLAQNTNSRIIILHTFFIPPPLPAELKVKKPEDVYHYGQEMLDKSCNDFAKKYISKKVKSSCLVKRGFVLDEIVKIINEENVNMVIMNTEGAHGIKELFPGTITSRIIDNVKCPVMVIPDNYEFTPLDKIVYATDMKGNEEGNFEYVRNIASVFNSKITFLNISKSLTEEERKEKIHKMNTLAENMGIKKPSFEIIQGKNTFASIIDYIKIHNAQMLMISTKKRPALQRLFTRSLTKKMAHHAFVPVLAMHKN
ncbi:MAG: universal stress protein [Cytophagaceae bacterium]